MAPISKGARRSSCWSSFRQSHHTVSGAWSSSRLLRPRIQAKVISRGPCIRISRDSLPHGRRLQTPDIDGVGRALGSAEAAGDAGFLGKHRLVFHVGDQKGATPHAGEATDTLAVNHLGPPAAVQAAPGLDQGIFFLIDQFGAVKILQALRHRALFQGAGGDPADPGGLLLRQPRDWAGDILPTQVRCRPVRRKWSMAPAARRPLAAAATARVGPVKISPARKIPALKTPGSEVAMVWPDPPESRPRPLPAFPAGRPPVPPPGRWQRSPYPPPGAGTGSHHRWGQTARTRRR